ncbi:MAG: T9SS type A sorting domain-containing protein [Flavobacteriaceae bacterium]|nr:T9SS type A sorting domain-containing protein [Bacteroidia bacterium]NNK82316.1 T9SS type A sorting domain-containing protein [Flavobacteriaceae bacterium]
MKQLYLCLTILVFCFNYLNAQTVSVTGSCFYLVDGDYIYNGDVNGRPSFFHDPEPSPGGLYTILWTGTRWELTAEDYTGAIVVGSHNNLDTPYPPATSLSPWTPDACNPAGVFAGDGTSTTMSIIDVEKESIKIYPIPSTDLITISGLQDRKDYCIFNIFGQIVLEGTINNYNKINIQNFSNGIYVLRFDTGQTIKFIKN